MPIQICGLSSFEVILFRSHEEILIQCAAGIAACEKLSNEGDLATPFTLLTTYLPTLSAIVRDNTAHRRSAALLTTQCLFTQTILAMHLEHHQQALDYAKQAATYSETTGDIPLQIMALGRLAWVYLSINQRKTALEKALHMQAVFQRNSTRLSSNVQSYAYGVLAKNQALNRQDEAAQKSLRRARQAFFSTSAFDTYMKHDQANFLTDDGVTHLFLAQPEVAIQTFAQIIKLDDLTPRIPLTRRFHPEVVNNLTLALLKVPQKDMEKAIFCWQTGLREAQELRSEQRFKESINLQALLEMVWPGEKRIIELRDCVVHWEEAR